MTPRILKSLLIVLLAVGVIFPAALAVAKDKSQRDCQEKDHQIIIGNGDGGMLTIEKDGSELVITEGTGDDSRVTVVDIEQVGQMVGESLGGLVDLVADMQLEMRLGNDNNFTLAFDDEEIEVDFDAIFQELGEVLEGAFDEVDTGDWSSHRHHRTIDRTIDRTSDRIGHVHSDASRLELQELRRELKELKAELRRLQNVRDEG